MKKFVKVAILLVCLIAITVSGCSLFGGNESEKAYTLSIVYDDETQTFENLSADSVRITPKFKKGYVLTGYYAQKDGQGEQFLNYKGKSIKTGGWRSSYPTTLYPKYEPLDYSKKCTATYITDTPTKFTYNIYEDPKKGNLKLTDERFSYILMASYSNPEAKLKISVSAEIRRNGKDEGTTTFSLGLGDDIETGLLARTSFKPPLTFINKTLTAEVTGRAIANNEDKEIIFGFFWGRLDVDSYGVVKNVELTVNFIE